MINLKTAEAIRRMITPALLHGRMILEELLAADPRVPNAGTMSCRASDHVLRFIDEHVRPGHWTLEIGAGVSTRCPWPIDVEHTEGSTEAGTSSRSIPTRGAGTQSRSIGIQMT